MFSLQASRIFCVRNEYIMALYNESRHSTVNHCNLLRIIFFPILIESKFRGNTYCLSVWCGNPSSNVWKHFEMGELCCFQILVRWGLTTSSKVDAVQKQFQVDAVRYTSTKPWRYVSNDGFIGERRSFKCYQCVGSDKSRFYCSIVLPVEKKKKNLMSIVQIQFP